MENKKETYYERNREKCRAYSREYYKRKKESSIIELRAYKAEKARKYREKNREKLRAYNTEYQRKKRAKMKDKNSIDN